MEGENSVYKRMKKTDSFCKDDSIEKINHISQKSYEDSTICRKCLDRMAIALQVLKEDISPSGQKVDWRSVTWRILNGIMATFFFFAAIVQVNDPDPALWIVLYLAPACLCSTIFIYPALQELRIFEVFAVLQLFLCTAAIVYTVYNGADELAKHKGNILGAEVGREAAGLTIAAIWLSLMLIINSKSVQSMKVINWIQVILVAFSPFIFVTLWMYTVDFSKVPEHCRAIVKGL